MSWTTGKRKLDHLHIAARERVEYGDTWFDDVILVHESVPELDLNDINTKTKFLGKELKYPFMIVGMTGGVEEAKEINRDIAKVAENLGIGFGLGSQRAMLERAETWESYYVREEAPKTLVIGNIGLAQLGDYPKDKIKKAMKKIGADAMAVHMNPAQEAVQPEGDWDFKDKLPLLKELAGEIPVIAKEVGNGVCREIAIKLRHAGVKAVDIGGFGGTNWVLIEAMRHGEKTPFINWGIPTAASVLEVAPILPAIATGGIRNGMEAAKAIALGASLVGIGLPALRWYLAGGKELLETNLIRMLHEFKIAMFLTGSSNVRELKETNLVITGKLREWCLARGIDIKHYANREAGKAIF